MQSTVMKMLLNFARSHVENKKIDLFFKFYISEVLGLLYLSTKKLTNTGLDPENENYAMNKKM